ncbi:hypothetical protein ACFZAU_03690 [Streptomyces sp. NPDC008238]
MRLPVVRGTHHDLRHRPMAAEVVTFLDTPRDGPVPVVAAESSAP